MRKPALAALSLAAFAAGSAAVPATADAAPSIKVRASQHVLVGNQVKVKGKVAADGRRPVHVQRYRGGWRTIEKDRTGRSGRFSASFRSRRLGRMKVRVIAAGTRSRSRPTTVYRRVHASYYGPGLWGNRLGCGGRLRYGTIGVAHKSLPCGTKVRLRYRGRAIRVRVIDRGPYAAGRTYDLTQATKRRLRFPDIGTVWSSR